MAIRKLLAPTVLIIGLCASVQPANAITQTYCGPNVCYQYDDAQNAGLFGVINFSGDNAYWTPTNFEARSQDGVALPSNTNTDVADQTWQFSKVYTADPTKEILSIQVVERGDYSINYAAGEVHGDLYLLSQGLGIPNIFAPAMTATDSVDQVGAPFGLQLWQMNATLTPAATLAALANQMTLTVQNTLSAFTSNSTLGSELAWIEKKLTIDLIVTVPVPAAVWLMGSALGLLGFSRRRAGA